MRFTRCSELDDPSLVPTLTGDYRVLINYDTTHIEDDFENVFSI